MIFVNIVLFFVLGVSSFTDIRYRKIASGLLGISAVLLMALLGWLGVLTLRRLLGALFVCGVFLGISVITGEKIGVGDGLLFGLVGLAVGLQRNIMIILISFGIAFFIALLLFVSKKADRDTEIPLAPILLISTVFTLWNQPLP